MPGDPTRRAEPQAESGFKGTDGRPALPTCRRSPDDAPRPAAEPLTIPQQAWRWTPARLSLVVLAWLAVAIITSIQHHLASSDDAVVRPLLPIFGYGVVWYGGWALLTPVIAALVPIIGRSRGWIRPLALHLMAAVLIGLLHNLVFAVILTLVERGKVWDAATGRIWLQKFGDTLHVLVLTYGMVSALFTALARGAALRQQELDAARLSAELATAQAAALRAQLHPHFLFNTLNAVSALVATEPVVARRMIAKLGALLRMAINPERGPFSSVAAELAFTRAYLDIEAMRMADRLRVELDIAPETLALPVPSLLLQPLAENAIRHGLSPRPGGGTLRIAAVRQQDRLVLTVADDGCGAALATDGIGLGHLRSRLDRHYQGRASVAVDTRPGDGFRVQVTVPL